MKYRRSTLLLLPGTERPTYAGLTVEVLEMLDSELVIEHDGQVIPSQEAPPRPSVLRDVNGYSSQAPPERNGLGSRWVRVLASLDRERRFTVRSTDVPAGPMRCDMTTPNTTGFRLPDPPERGADEFTRARHLFMTGSAHHLARHLGRPDTTLVSAELYITHVPRSRQDGRIPGPDLLVAFDVDPEIY